MVGAAASVSPFPISLRLGAMVSPRIAFNGGIDVRFPQLHLGSGLTARADFNAIVAANFGGVNSIFDLTFGAVYGFGIATGQRVYVGAGVGPYFADQVRFGGRLILGVNATSRIGGELNLHFAGIGNPLLTLQVRLRL